MGKNRNYRVIGRKVSGSTLVGYFIQELNTGNVAILTKEQTEKMAINKLLDNVTAQIYEGRVLLRGSNGRLSDLPTYDLEGNKVGKTVEEAKKEVYIAARVFDGRNIVGYVLNLMVNGEIKGRTTVSKDDILVLAKDGKIANANVQMNNGVPVLRGVNCNLSQLDSVKA